MAELREDQHEVNARIVYWGVEGSGKTTSIRIIGEKLRPDHRGDFRAMPTALDPSVSYDILPIELGSVGGVRTRIQLVGVPGGDEHAATRKQLLDRVDGVVFVIDSQRERIDENLASFEELRQALLAYGRALSEVPLVLQYNKRDLSDPFALEELHRKLDMRGAAAFESVATEGTSVLQTLTTVSKRVIRFLREQSSAPAASATPPPVAPPPGVSQILDADLLEAARAGAPDYLASEPSPPVAARPAAEPFAPAELPREAPDLLAMDTPRDPTGARLHIESAEAALVTDARTVRLPVVLRDGERRLRLTLTWSLDAVDDPSEI